MPDAPEIVNPPGSTPAPTAPDVIGGGGGAPAPSVPQVVNPIDLPSAPAAPQLADPIDLPSAPVAPQLTDPVPLPPPMTMPSAVTDLLNMMWSMDADQRQTVRNIFELLTSGSIASSLNYKANLVTPNTFQSSNVFISPPVGLAEANSDGAFVRRQDVEKWYGNRAEWSYPVFNYTDAGVSHDLDLSDMVEQNLSYLLEVVLIGGRGLAASIGRWWRTKHFINLKCNSSSIFSDIQTQTVEQNYGSFHVGLDKPIISYAISGKNLTLTINDTDGGSDGGTLYVGQVRRLM